MRSYSLVKITGLFEEQFASILKKDAEDFPNLWHSSTRLHEDSPGNLNSENCKSYIYTYIHTHSYTPANEEKSFWNHIR